MKRTAPNEQNHFNHLCFSYKKNHFQGFFFQNEASFSLICGNKQWLHPLQRYFTNIKETATNERSWVRSCLLQRLKLNEQLRMRGVWRWPSLYYNSRPPHLVKALNVRNRLDGRVLLWPFISLRNPSVTLVLNWTGELDKGAGLRAEHTHRLFENRS